MDEKELLRDEEINRIWKNPDTRLIYKLLGAAVLVGIGVYIGWVIYSNAQPSQAWGYGENLFTGVISTAATVLILDQLAERRADRKAEEALKEQLIEDAASRSNEIALNAVHQIRRKRWLRAEDGLLKQADLYRANLQDVDLYKANLQNTNLRRAKLGGANFRLADLCGADLSLTDLRGAVFSETKFDAATKLPDDSEETPSRWTEVTDMSRFTNPSHPDFWRSNDPESPAYRG